MSEYSEKMDKAIEATEREFSKIRAGQASPAILNDVRIDYYGTPTPISQVAKVSVPEPRMLLVSPWEKTMVDPIEKAILAANIGLTPMKDGNCIRVTLPILTAERRQELAKIVRKHAEEGRVAIRNIRRDANDAIKKNTEPPRRTLIGHHVLEVFMWMEGRQLPSPATTREFISGQIINCSHPR